MQKFPLTKHSKRYWLDKIYKPEVQRADGSKSVSDNYAVYLCYAGKEKRLSLGTPNRIAAAELARDWFVYLSANGWDAFQAKYRKRNSGRSADPEKQDCTGNVTVGEFLAAVSTESDLSRKTFKDYATCLRFVVSEIYRIEKDKKRHDHRKGGRQAWIKRIDATVLADVTPDKVRTWKRLYIDMAGRDELARRRRTVSCNSYLRRARALFAPKA